MALIASPRPAATGQSPPAAAMTRPTALDLFGGVGGMALGFEQAGFDVVCALEIDPAHAAAHRFNFPRCELLQADATTVTAETLEAAVAAGMARNGRSPNSRVDVVFGGPPCQGFSVGGLLDPEDPRNQLVGEYARLVRMLRPRAFVLENVPTMTTRCMPGTDQTVPDWIESALASDGYRVTAAEVLNAAHFGVPQDRRRLLIVGVRGNMDIALPAPMFAARPRAPSRVPKLGERGHPAMPADMVACPTVAEAISDLPDIDGFEALLGSDAVTLRDVPPPDPPTVSRYASRLRGAVADPSDLSWPRTWVASELTSSMRTTHGAEVRERFKSVLPGDQEPVSRFIRLHQDGISPTLRAGTTPDRGSYSAPRPIHYASDRVISVREAARLHGFPDWFRFTAAKWHGFRQVGNAVCPPLAKAVAESVRDGLALDRVQPGEAFSLGSPELLRVPSGGGRRASGSRRRASASDAATAT